MNVYMMLAVFFVLLVLVFVYARFARQRPPTPAERLRRVAGVFENLQYAIGGALVPAFRSTIKAFQDFEEAFARANATIQQDISTDFVRCCIDDCCGPGSYCCRHANPHTHDEEDDART